MIDLMISLMGQPHGLPHGSTLLAPTLIGSTPLPKLETSQMILAMPFAEETISSLNSITQK